MLCFVYTDWYKDEGKHLEMWDYMQISWHHFIWEIWAPSHLGIQWYIGAKHWVFVEFTYVPEISILRICLMNSQAITSIDFIKIFEMSSHFIISMLAWNTVCGPGWHWTHKTPPASASQVLGLRECSPTPGFLIFLKHIKFKPLNLKLKDNSLTSKMESTRNLHWHNYMY